VVLAFLTSTPLDVIRGSGTSAGILTLARALQARGVEVQVVTPSRTFPVYTLERLRFNEELRRMDWSRYDAVVGFDMDGWRIAGRTGRPHIASIKGVIADEMRFERGLTRATMAIQAACERRHVQRAGLVLTTSRYAAGRIEELYRLKTPPGVVPELIDLAAWRKLLAQNQAARDAVKFRVFCVCRFYPRKRLEVVLKAVAQLRERIPSLELRIAGGGPEEARLHRLAKELRQEVSWLGNISREELAREYQRADVFALPSVQEGFGIVFLEAMAAGAPIVAARAAAVPEVVTAGLLTAPGNPAELAAGIETLYQDPALRRRLAKAGANAVLQYDAARVAAKFIELIKESYSTSEKHKMF
jgi:glycosyltransferase involved in cell wall biosynthesis